MAGFDETTEQAGAPKRIATLRKNPEDGGQYLVACWSTDDQNFEVAIFSGPHALDRAVGFAGGDWFDGWRDPQGLTGT